MEILIINKYSYLKGGAERYVKELLRLLEKHKIHTSFFSTKPKRGFDILFDSSLAKERDKKIYLTDLLDFKALSISQKIRSVLKVFYNAKANLLLQKAIARANFNVAHINNVYYQLPASLINILYRKKIPIVMTVHDFKPVHFNYNLFNIKTHKVCNDALGGKQIKCFFHNCTGDRFFDRLVKLIESYFCRLSGVYSKISAFIAPSLYIRNILVEAGFDASRIFVLPNFIDISKYKISHRQGEFFTYFGRISNEKGIDLLIGAAANLPGEKFYIVGEGPYKKELKSAIAKKKLKNITLKNWLQDNELKKILVCSKAVMVPSLWPENCPYVVLEALAMGRPVISSRIGGLIEIIKDGYNGYTFQTGSVDDLTDKIRRLIKQDKVKYLELSRNARYTAETQFNHDKYYKRLLLIYNYATKFTR